MKMKKKEEEEEEKHSTWNPTCTWPCLPRKIFVPTKGNPGKDEE
jgi:hypothetical protein